MTDDADLIIRWPDVRRVYGCRYGVKTFCQKYGFEYSDFLKGGVSAERLLATGDAMALHVVEAARGQQ